jgi:hypothetical protein
MKQTRTVAEFWSPPFAQKLVKFLTFILLTLQTLTKLKTTFGRNLLYWIPSNLLSRIFTNSSQINHKTPKHQINTTVS